jgi:hypothetical protein
LTILLIAACACAEEPNTPSDVSLIGTWKAPNANLFTLSNIRMELNQQDTGIVHGSWFARGSGGGEACPSGKPCDASGVVVGRSTIAKLSIELLGAGRFEGRLVDPGTMRGVLEVGNDYDTITFSRTSLTAASERGSQ